MPRKQEKILEPEIEVQNKDMTAEIFRKINEEGKSEGFIGNPEVKDVIDMSAEDMNRADTFFKKVIEELFSKKNISLKTEYMNEDEQFESSKIQFLVNTCGFKSFRGFLPQWKKDRVSLGRKSRQEIIMGLWERQKEVRALEEKQKMQNNQLNM